ncbi:MAG: hypothetical protein ACK5CA_10010 [Cyanobacteriota bacterium]|jgi:hypothetical protein
MEDWTETLLKSLTAALEDMETLWADLESAVAVTTEALETELAAEWEAFWREWIDPWLQEDGERNLWEPPPTQDGAPPDLHFGLVPYRPATARHQPLCQGCQHYHGFVYEGNLLVCAMHPSGVEGSSCPDWESAGG